MANVRVALANLPFPPSPRESVALAERAIADAGAQRAAIVCFPEAYGPGYRAPDKNVPPVDPPYLAAAWARIAAAAARARIAVVLGTERVVDGRLRLSALVVDPNGAVQGWQDKVQ